MREYIAALDQGTTSSRALLFDRAGRAVASAQEEFPQIYPNPGWVEHDPRAILSSQFGALRAVLKKTGISAEQLAAVGVANQRETVFLWDRFTGKPVYNAIVWQCRRTSAFCEQLARTHGEWIYERTGLRVDAYFSASKLKWMLDNVPFARERAERGELLFGTADTYLIWNLTGGKVHATDRTNASRTMLFNIHTLQWDEELCKLFGIPMCVLPEVRPSGAAFGETERTLFGAEIPVCAAVGDQQGALFGHLCVEEGTGKTTYGTGCFLLVNTGERAVRSRNGLITTLTASLAKPQYALEGSVFVGGAAVQWLRDGLGLVSSAKETEEVAKSVPDTGGVSFVPAFVGLGAPHWDQNARGIIMGLTRGTNRCHIARAALESIAFQANDIIRAMEADSKTDIHSVKVDGGASANNFLCQFLADITGMEVERPRCIESTALGAAYMAGLTVGFWDGEDDLRENWSLDRRFVPQMGEAERQEHIRGWNHAVRCARLWSDAA